MLLRAFSSGAVALTGVEAISDGVPAFRSPSRRTRPARSHAMAIILGTAFFGLAVLTHRLRPTVPEDETLLSILGKAVYGAGIVHVLRPAVLDVRHPDPRRQHRIRRLPAAVVDHRARRLPPSADGQPRRPARLLERDRRARRSGERAHRGLRRRHCGADPALRGRRVHRLHALPVRDGPIPALAPPPRLATTLGRSAWSGSIATGIVLLVVVVSKFTKGAWIPAVVIPVIVLLFVQIGRHYRACERRSTCRRDGEPKRHTHNVVVLVGGVNRGVLQALTYARSLAPDRLIAVSVVSDELEQERITKQWAEYEIPIELHVLHSAVPRAHAPRAPLPRRARQREPRRHDHGRDP